MPHQKTSSLSLLLEEVAHMIQAGPIEPDVQRHCINTLSMALQTFAQTKDRSLLGRDMQEIRGNNHVKRALEVAAAGGHSLLLSGPHQSGKTQCAQTLSSVLPASTISYPFRAPDSSIERNAFLGDSITTGEMTFAHEGILFLKDLHQFNPILLDAVRQAVETHVVAFAVGKEHIHFPATFILVATTMPCPCGFHGDLFFECTCSAEMIIQHQQRVKTIIDSCFDINVEVPRVREDLLSRHTEESSVQVRSRVEQARKSQSRRYAEDAGVQVNADLGSIEEVQRYCLLDPSAEGLLKRALRQLHPSPLGILHMQKVARTIADLAGSERIEINHLAEAIQYRSRMSRV